MTRDDQGTAIGHATLTDWPRCPECGDKIINRGAHAERCVGPRAHGRCECPPGWRHLPDCVEVTGGWCDTHGGYTGQRCGGRQYDGRECQ